MKIDVFSHFLPKKYFEALRQKSKGRTDLSQLGQRILKTPALGEIDIRLRLMDRYPDVLQVLTVATPPLETLVTPSDAIELAKMANDELAGLVSKYPDKFIAAVACLPLNDIDAALTEADRAVKQLNFRGVQIFTNINGELLDSPRLRLLYEKMAQHDLPIWIHPWDPTIMSSSIKDLPVSVHDWGKQLNTGSLIWPFETSLAMMRLILAGVFEDCPNIKFITHHCGGMVPFFERRIGIDSSLRPNLQSLRKFYNDTAVYGSTAALMCGYAFFGADHLLFGTDMPLGANHLGACGYTLETIRSIERMDVPSVDKCKIFEVNTRQLLKLEM